MAAEAAAPVGALAVVGVGVVGADAEAAAEAAVVKRNKPRHQGTRQVPAPAPLWWRCCPPLPSDFWWSPAVIPLLPTGFLLQQQHLAEMLQAQYVEQLQSRLLRGSLLFEHLQALHTRWLPVQLRLPVPIGLEHLG